MLPALLGLIAPVAAIKAVSQLLRAARSLTPQASLSGPPAAEKAAEVSEPKPARPVIFAYDGRSHRTKITEFTNGTVTSKKLYFWIGGRIVCERDGLQTGFPITKRFFGVGEVRGTTKLYYTRDHLGSIRELVDSAGTVQAEYSYSTYGERTKQSGNLDCDWGYGGLWHHQASGLDLSVYRVYDAANKRWISRDPLGEGSDRSLYSYCGNNPISFVDPSGLLRLDPTTGDYLFTPVGDPEVMFNGGGCSLMQPGFLWADDGTPIRAMRNMQHKEHPNFDADCHGCSFTGGRFWINNDDMYPILNGDGWRDRSKMWFDRGPHKGDVVVYKDSSGRVVHSTTVVQNNPEGTTTVWGKSGSESHAYPTTLENAWPGDPAEPWNTIYHEIWGPPIHN